MFNNHTWNHKIVAVEMWSLLRSYAIKFHMEPQNGGRWHSAQVWLYMCILASRSFTNFCINSFWRRSPKRMWSYVRYSVFMQSCQFCGLRSFWIYRTKYKSTQIYRMRQTNVTTGRYNLTQTFFLPVSKEPLPRGRCPRRTCSTPSSWSCTARGCRCNRGGRWPRRSCARPSDPRCSRCPFSGGRSATSWCRPARCTGRPTPGLHSNWSQSFIMLKLCFYSFALAC